MREGNFGRAEFRPYRANVGLNRAEFLLRKIDLNLRAPIFGLEEVI